MGCYKKRSKLEAPAVNALGILSRKLSKRPCAARIL
jgi:hypothetical protein